MPNPKISYDYELQMTKEDAKDWEAFNKVHSKAVIVMYGKRCLVFLRKYPTRQRVMFSCNDKVNKAAVERFIKKRLDKYRVSKLIRGHK